MGKENKSSRRSFLKSTALVTGGLLGGSVYACTAPIKDKEIIKDKLHYSLVAFTSFDSIDSLFIYLLTLRTNI